MSKLAWLLLAAAGCISESRHSDEDSPPGRFEALGEAVFRGDVGPVIDVDDPVATTRFRQEEILQIEVEGHVVERRQRAWVIFQGPLGEIGPNTIAPGQVYTFPDDARSPNPLPFHLQGSACSGTDGDFEIYDTKLAAFFWQVEEGAETGSLRVRFEGVIEPPDGEPFGGEQRQTVEGHFELTQPVYAD